MTKTRRFMIILLMTLGMVGLGGVSSRGVGAKTAGGPPQLPVTTVWVKGSASADWVKVPAGQGSPVRGLLDSFITSPPNPALWIRIQSTGTAKFLDNAAYAGLMRSSEFVGLSPANFPDVEFSDLQGNPNVVNGQTLQANNVGLTLRFSYVQTLTNANGDVFTYYRTSPTLKHIVHNGIMEILVRGGRRYLVDVRSKL
jgi:hypothetical protein